MAYNVSGCRTRRPGATFAQANGVTGQGLGERNEVTGAGNPVLGEVRFHLQCSGKSVASPKKTRLHVSHKMSQCLSIEKYREWSDTRPPLTRTRTTLD